MNKATLVFSNNQYVNNKKISNNMIKSKLITNLKKAEKLLSQNKFKELQTDLLINLKNNNSIVVNINGKNNYKYEIYNGGNSTNNTNNTNSKNSSKNNTIERDDDEYIPTQNKINESSKSTTNTITNTTTNKTMNNTNTTSITHTEESDPTKSTDSIESTTETDDLESTNSSQKETSDNIPKTPETNNTEEIQETPSILPKNTLTEESITNNSTKTNQTNTTESKSWFSGIFSGGKNDDNDSDNDQTYLIDSDSDDEESFIDKAKLNNKKYLNTLNVNKLRDIMRNNELKLSKNGSYLKKNEMIKQIQKKYK